MIHVFEGYVYEVHDDTFTIVFYERSMKDPIEEQADIYKSYLSEEELTYLAVGAIFEWKIDSISGTNSFEFCKKVWTQEDLDKAEEEAKKFECLFDIKGS